MNIMKIREYNLLNWQRHSGSIDSFISISNKYDSSIGSPSTSSIKVECIKSRSLSVPTPTEVTIPVEKPFVVSEDSAEILEAAQGIF